MKRSLACFLFLLVACANAQAQTAPQESQDCAEAKARTARLETRLQDWPALARYREANATLQPPAKGERRVVFMGDSITDGWKLDSYFPGKSYINRGISGQTTSQMLIRFRPDVIALKPEVVVILAGTNDLAGNTGPMTLEAIENNLASMMELARINGIRVVIASVLPVNDYGKNRDGMTVNRTTQRPPQQIKSLNEWMKKYAAQNDLTYLDYFSPMVDEKGFLKEELSGDGLHPNDKGYAIMQPLVEQAIATALKKRR
jgi:lysophospholipase L1-like esterase